MSKQAGPAVVLCPKCQIIQKAGSSLSRVLKCLAEWHDKQATCGGASREFHERAASACFNAAQILKD